MFGRAMMAAGWHVATDHLADRLGPFPANIAFMGVRHKRQPIGTCLPARLHTGGAVACRHSRLTISIGAAVDGVLDHPMDGGVVRAPPNRIAVLALHRKVEIMLVEPEQSLACAAEFQHLVEDQRDGLLHAAIGILLVMVTGFDEPHRRADDELATARLLVACRERALAQEIKFVFVEASLQPEQQPVIAVPGRVDRLLIDQHGIDNAARWTPPAAERPRSSSMTSISDQPSAARRSRMAYCNALLSRLCRT